MSSERFWCCCHACCVRCSGCELLVQSLEEQVLKANLRRDQQIQLNKDIEQQVRTLSVCDLTRCVFSSDDLIYQKYRYIIVDIDVLYHIVKKYGIFRYITISFICRNIFDI